MTVICDTIQSMLDTPPVDMQHNMDVTVSYLRHLSNFPGYADHKTAEFTSLAWLFGTTLFSGGWQAFPLYNGNV
jgi:hypothetical protein